MRPILVNAPTINRAVPIKSNNIQIPGKRATDIRASRNADHAVVLFFEYVAAQSQGGRNTHATASDHPITALIITNKSLRPGELTCAWSTKYKLRFMNKRTATMSQISKIIVTGHLALMPCHRCLQRTGSPLAARAQYGSAEESAKPSKRS